MTCKQCGRQVPDHAVYCRYCGARFTEEGAAKNPAAPVRKKKSILPVVIAALLILGLIGGSVFFLRSRKPEADPGTSPEAETMNNGSSPEDGTETEQPVTYTLRIEGEDSVEAGKDAVLKAVVEPETAVKQTVWTSSNEAAAIVIDGIVTGEAAGETVIRCTMALENGQTLEAELPFIVKPTPVKYKLHLEPEKLEIRAGSADTFTVVIETDPEGEKTDAEIRWESSDTLVAAVTDGRVQAVGEGEARITAYVTLPDGSNQSVTGSVTVTAAQANPAPSAAEIPVPAATPEPAPAPAPAPTPEPTPAPAPAKPVFEPAGVAPEKTDAYLAANSDSAYLNVDELLKLSDEELILARNEIFARHGRQFQKDWIREYFEGKSWYNGTIAPDDFDPDVLNEYEHANVSRLQYAERNN